MPQQTQLSETRLLDLLLHVADNLDDGVIAFDIRCRYIFWNRAMERITGLLAGEIVGRNVFEAFPALQQNGQGKLLQETLAGRTITSSDVPFLVPDGKQGCFEATYHPFKEWGKVAGGVAIVRDLTLRRRAQTAEAALDVSEQHFQRLFAHSPLSMQIIAPDGRVRSINSAYERLFGITLEQLSGANILEDQQLIDLGIMADVQAVFHGETRTWAQLAHVPDRGSMQGHKIWTRSFMYPVMEDGGVREIVWCQQDITAQKQAETGLAESEARFRRAHRTGKIGAYELDLHSRVMRWFVEVPALQGLAADGQLSSWLRLLSPEDRRHAEAGLQQLLAGNGKPLEVCMHRPDGERLWLRCGGELVNDESGTPTHIIGTVLDITEARAAEEILRKSEENFRFLANSLPQIVWTSGPQGEPEFYNEQWFTYVGLRQETQVWNRFDYEHPADRQRSAELWQQALTLGERYEMEVRLRRGHDQSYRWHLVRSIPMRDDAGRIIKWFGTATDIHELQIAKDQLRLSRERLRLAQQAARAGLWELDLETHELTYSEEFAALARLPVGGVVSFDDLIAVMTFASDQEKAANALQQVMLSKKDYTVEFRLRDDDGEIRRILLRGQVVQVRSKQVLVGLAMDVTEPVDQATPAIVPAKNKKTAKKSDQQKKPAEEIFRTATG